MDEHSRLEALDHMARTMGISVALIQTDPKVELHWLQAGKLATHFEGEGPSVSQLFAAAVGENQKLLADFWADMERFGSSTCELELELPSAERSWFRLQSSRYPLGDGRTSLLLSCTDIAQQLSSQSARIEARRKETIQNMAAGIAHEFNNNLTPIRGFIELTLDTLDEDHPAVDGLYTALEQAEVCADLVQQIMFSSSKSVLSLREVDPATLLSNILYDASHTLLQPEQHIEIIEDIDSKLPPIKIDQKVFRDAIRHLISNAVTAMPEGGTLKISAKVKSGDPRKTESAANDHVLITIADNGTGISKQDIQRVFDPFFTTHNRAEARGMGLPMVQGMISQMGGAVEIDSGPNEGTRVTIHLPISQESKEADRPDSGTAPTPAIPSAPGRMLIADDEDYILKLITRLFSSKGWEITQASSFYEVLNEVSQHPTRFDVLVLDVGMPGPSAEETLKRIRDAHCQSHIVLVSGFPENDRIRNLVELCDGSFISKPFSLSSLLARVQGLMADFL